MISRCLRTVINHIIFNLYLLVTCGSIVLYTYYPNVVNIQLIKSMCAVCFAYISIKVLFEYIHMPFLLKKARETATGAGAAFLGVCVVIYGLLQLGGQL